MRFIVGENVGEGSSSVNEETSVYDERKKLVDKHLPYPRGFYHLVFFFYHKQRFLHLQTNYLLQRFH